MENKTLTGYPSIDRPWLKYYSEEAIQAPLPECTMYEYIWENNKDHLDDVALSYFGKTISYRKLFEKIEQTARAFLAKGVKEGDVVTVCMLNQPETVYILYALNRIGAITCVVNVLSSEQELSHYMEESHSAYLVTSDLFFDKSINAARKVNAKHIIWVSLYEALGSIKRAAYRLKVKKPSCKEDNVSSWGDFIKDGITTDIISHHIEETTCVVIGHTGGTTGVPKGVKLTNLSFNGIAAQYQCKLSYVRQDKFLNLVVPFAVYGLIVNLHMPLSLGMTVILIPKVDPNNTDKLLHKYKPNHVISIPGYWQVIVRSKVLKDMSWLKTSGAGGAGMSAELENTLNAFFLEHGIKSRFLNGYGMSEVGATACTQQPDSTELCSVGIPLVKTVIAAFDPETLSEKSYGDEGELCIQTPCMMLGYIENESETQKTMRKHPDGKIWIHSGDIGYVNERGSVFVTGRMKRIYLTHWGGTISKIFPDRIEQTLQSHAYVERCCLVCISNSQNVYLPIAFVVIKDNCIPEKEKIKTELSSLCKHNLPEYAQPIDFHFVSTLPLTPVGKVDYRTLEKLAQEQYKYS